MRCIYQSGATCERRNWIFVNRVLCYPFIVLLFFLINDLVFAEPLVDIQLIPSTPSVEWGTTFTIELQVDVGNTDLGSYYVSILYNSNHLQFQDIKPGTTIGFSDDKIEYSTTQGMIRIIDIKQIVNPTTGKISLFFLQFKSIKHLSTLSSIKVQIINLLDVNSDQSLTYPVIGYCITDATINKIELIREGGVQVFDEETILKFVPLKNQEFESKELFENALIQALGQNNTQILISTILKYATLSYELSIEIKPLNLSHAVECLSLLIANNSHDYYPKLDMNQKTGLAEVISILKLISDNL